MTVDIDSSFCNLHTLARLVSIPSSFPEKMTMPRIQRRIAIAAIAPVLATLVSHAAAQTQPDSRPSSEATTKAESQAADTQSLMELIDLAGSPEQALAKIDRAYEILDAESDPLEMARQANALLPKSFLVPTNFVSSGDPASAGPQIRSSAADHNSWNSLAAAFAVEEWTLAGADPHGLRWTGESRRCDTTDIEIGPGSIIILKPSSFPREVVFLEGTGNGIAPHVLFRKNGRLLQETVHSTRSPGLFHCGNRGSSPTGQISWFVPAGVEIVAWNRASMKKAWTGVMASVEVKGNAK